MSNGLPIIDPKDVPLIIEARRQEMSHILPGFYTELVLNVGTRTVRTKIYSDVERERR